MASSFHRARHWGWPLAFGLSLTASSQMVLAQTAGSDAELDTLTVKGNRLYEMLPSEMTGGYTVDAATVGTKTPASLRDIPQSVSVMTREALEDQNFNTLDQMAKRTPGMRVLPNDSGRSSIYSRGYEYNEYNIDGLPAPMASILGSVPNLEAFDRVEIMRGPSGLFNSTSELGGIVNMVRKRPTYDFQGHVLGRYGSWDQNHEEVDLSGPINSDGSVRGRMVIANDDSNGYVDENDNTNQTFYGDIDIDLDDATTLSLAYLRQHRDIVPTNGVPAAEDGSLLDFTRSSYFGADWNTFNSQSNDWIAELTHRFDNGGYGRVATRYSNRDADYQYAYTFSGVDEDGNSSLVGLGGKVNQETWSVDASYSQPFQTFGGVSEFVVGTDYKRYETETAQGVARLGTIDVYDYSSDQFDEPDIAYTRADNRTTLEEYGLYSKLTFRPIQPLALIAGGRVSSYRQDLTSYLDGSSDSRSDDAKFTPYAGIVFDLDNHHSLYASYSEVFTPQSDAVGENGELIKPREGEQYEVGVKGSYFDGDLNARISAFRMYDENRAASVGAGSSAYSAALGKTRIDGAEFEVSGALTPQWSVIAGYTYLDIDVREAAGNNDVAFTLMPKNQFNLWTKYGFAGGALDGLEVGGGVTALSDFETLSSPQVEAPGYAVVDAMVGYRFTSHIKGQLNFNNILDKTYYERVGSVSTFNMYGAPSNVVASLRYDF
ncbi:TonB-dependent siderophore receptor [Salinicola rhizosphaerae]|uniref:TonB-dependent receptor n=1 Tax=Salinicola rhizosphaerae TaxID=1443141 RepID=A0ABQ3EDB9_9GAMM|nr:TonB-dependent siderophore receptor [Salinicola rhizosphaerae]GHB28675.1 TonB-dependent receptor [Salinicola rhizosphaerae]